MSNELTMTRISTISLDRIGRQRTAGSGCTLFSLPFKKSSEFSDLLVQQINLRKQLCVLLLQKLYYGTVLAALRWRRSLLSRIL